MDRCRFLRYNLQKRRKKGRIAIRDRPENFKLEDTTIWSFPDRGSWATHSGKYRGNWSPYVPRNLILRYTRKNDWVLDQFLGSGTTLIEAKLLGRNAIGVDVNPNSIKLSNSNLHFTYQETSKIFTKQGNARQLSFIKDQSIDLVCTHPPYADIIHYSQDIQEDISHLTYEDFLQAMEDVAGESYRVLKEGGICAFMIGDIRRKGYVLPLGMNTMQKFTDVGLFILKEIIIKEQHNCRSADYWEGREKTFLMLAHEYIFVLEKRSDGN
ncbi:MAG: methyltransferase domain-containing protein [Clostridiales bacterium]|nr:methyltransferase domain-containing protein [Clostridiales bacterium]